MRALPRVQFDGVWYYGDDRLGIDPQLAVHLRSTNPIESAFDRVRRLGARVKRWRGGDMKRRWCATGLLEAEKKFRRLKGHAHMPHFIRALDRITELNSGASKIASETMCSPEPPLIVSTTGGTSSRAARLMWQA